jgi:REP element-mobilizing transposase RayT
MPQSLARVVLHIAFSTKHRAPFLRNITIRKNLHAYIAVVLQGIDCEPILINGTEDHIHILCNFSRTITIASLIETVKTAPSKWMKAQGPEYEDFFWQSGYGVFSVSQSKVEQARDYIANQDEHHRHRSFQEEFRELCGKHGIELDEHYVWD